MKIRLERTNALPECTIGKLYLDDVFFCYTLEDIERDQKVYGQTAIPKGAYSVTIDHSIRFKTDLPRLLDVPGFEGVRIHPGNHAEDTEGCILVGKKWSGGAAISESRAAFGDLMARLRDCGEPITIEIV